MKKASPCLAGLAALALALTVVAAPAEPEPKPETEPEPVKKPPARDLTSPYAHSAVGAVLDANSGRVPATITELLTTLAKLGDFVQLPVPFSAVALDSGLTHPRVIITARPSTTPKPKSVFVPTPPGTKPATRFGWGGSSGTTKLIPQPPEPLNKVTADRTQLQGRLFLAANTEVEDGQSRVRTVEFISWNTRRLAFDFGVIVGLGTNSPELKVLDGTRCVSCHKNKGPILGVAPWSNTAHDPLVQKTAADAIRQNMGRGTAGLWNFSDPHGPEVDAAVRFGGDLLRDRAIFSHLADSPDGRRALELLLNAILTRGPLEKHDKEALSSVNALPIGRFVRNATQVRLNTPPSTLRDFSPAGPLTREVVGVAAGGRVMNQVERYDFARAHGRGRLPSEYLPSNPKAFTVAQPPFPKHPSDVVGAVLLAQTIGLSEADRQFLADALDEAVKRLNDWSLTRAAVAHSIFTGPAFADVMRAGNLPDRDDFKDRFVAGIADVFRNQQRKGDFWAPRDTYTSTPKFDPNAKPEQEVAVLPSHACLGCHDVRGPGKSPAFSPVPVLAFDPLDATARENWLKNATGKQKTEVLGRLVTRIGKDKDMPPADSLEADLYRTKDPAALNGLKEWCDAELKKVK